MNKQKLIKKNFKRIRLGKTSNGIMYYSTSDKSIEKTINIFETSYKKISKFFGREINEIKLILLYSRKEINKIIQMDTQKWVVGYSNPLQDNKIYIFSPLVFQKVSVHQNSDFAQTLQHEIAHLFIRQFHQSFEPLWLEEGLACVAAGQRKIPKEGKHQLNLSLETVFSLDTAKKWQKATNKKSLDPYLIGQTLVFFLISKYGRSKLFALLPMLTKKYDQKIFSRKFTEVYGQEITEVINRFNRKGGDIGVTGIRKRYYS